MSHLTTTSLATDTSTCNPQLLLLGQCRQERLFLHERVPVVALIVQAQVMLSLGSVGMIQKRFDNHQRVIPTFPRSPQRLEQCSCRATPQRVETLPLGGITHSG